MLTLQQLLSQIGNDRWQDVVLSAGNIFFCFTLIPMLRYPGRPPLLTCIPTGLALLAGGFVFATLHLWLTALTQTITGLQWLALALKKSRQTAPALPKGDIGGAGSLQRARPMKTSCAFLLATGIGCATIADISLSRAQDLDPIPVM
jgi:hypothetical protein